MKQKLVDSIFKQALRNKDAGTYDNLVRLKNIVNFDYLPQKLKEIIKKSFIIKSVGFREIAGYLYNKMFWKLEGDWSKDEDSIGFNAKRFNAKVNGQEIFWDRSRGLQIKELDFAT
jgi:hypothetical protein